MERITSVVIGAGHAGLAASYFLSDRSIDHVVLERGEVANSWRPDYSWLNVPVIDAKGQLRHDGGMAGSPGLYALGLPVLRRRKSTFICGIEDDARDVIGHLTRYLAMRQ